MTLSQDSRMSINDLPAAMPSAQDFGAQNFHPEFGYLCPSPRLRRQLRKAAMTVLAGMAIAAATAHMLSSVLVPRPPGEVVAENSGEKPLPPLAAAVLPPLAAAVLPPIMPAPLQASAAAFARAQASCDDPSASFLALQCQPGKAGKGRLTRSARLAQGASRRVATVPIGRIDPAPEAEQSTAAGPPAEAAPTVLATDEALLAPPPQKPAKPAKKVVKIVHRHAPNRDYGGVAPVAAAPSPGFGFFGSFREAPRKTNGDWASTWW
jgi:hypothetical protein